MKRELGHGQVPQCWHQSLLNVSGYILETDNRKDGRPVAQPKFRRQPWSRHTYGEDEMIHLGHDDVDSHPFHARQPCRSTHDAFVGRGWGHSRQGTHEHQNHGNRKRNSRPVSARNRGLPTNQHSSRAHDVVVEGDGNPYTLSNLNSVA